MELASAIRFPASRTRPISTTLDSEPFFSKYRSLLTPDEFGKFQKLISKTRLCRSTRYYIASSDGKLDYESYFSQLPDVQRHKEADLSKMEILLVEDVNLDFLMALDATYQLDPRFVLAYARVGSERSPEFETLTVPVNMTGKWYTTEISASLGSSLQVEGSNLLWFLSDAYEPWYKALLSKPRAPRPDLDLRTPWWKEAVRTYDGFTTTVRSKFACYCLSDKLRIVLVESFPDVVQSPISVADYSTTRPLESHLHLPFPMKHWDRKAPFNLWLILQILMRRFDFQHPSLRHVLLSDEVTQLELAKVAKLLDEHLILSPLIEEIWSASISYLIHHLSQRRSRALTQPSMETYLPLVDLRRPILGMLEAVSTAILDIPAIEKAYRKVCSIDPSNPSSGGSSPWVKMLHKVNVNLQALQKELNDEIHLVIGAVTVQDSDTSKRQAERATLLTLVAAVYLPLTLVTSIFGMNIKEIDGNLLTYRACLKALGVVLGCTILFAFAYREWRRWRRRTEERPSADRHSKFV